MDIYEKHNRAFKGISAYVIAKNNMRLATIAFKHNSHSGNVQCYLHIIGMRMALGNAGGGGYDKYSASAYDAIMRSECPGPATADILSDFKKALIAGNGAGRWDDELRSLGYQVWSAV